MEGDGDGDVVGDGAARRALDDAAALAGLDATGAEVVRAGASTVFRLPGSGWLARVAPPGAGGAAARREVAVAAVLAGADVPAVRLAPVDGQPLTVPAGVVTVWLDARPVPGEAAPGDLGRLARRLHDATTGHPALADLPALDPPSAAADRLHQAEASGTLAGADAEMMWAAHATLAAAWSARGPAAAPEALVHGDLHPGNVLVSPDGPVLADLELSGAGDPAYDLAPALVAVRRYGRPLAHHEDFAAAYGTDLRDHPDADLLCAVYELWVTAWSLAAAAAGPVLAREATRRLATWRGDPGAGAWTLY